MSWSMNNLNKEYKMYKVTGKLVAIHSYFSRGKITYKTTHQKEPKKEKCLQVRYRQIKRILDS